MANAKVIEKKGSVVTFSVVVPKEDVKKTHDHVVSDTAKQTEVKGFRKGQAPQKMVEEKLDTQKLYQSVLEHLLPNVYVEAVQTLNLQPIADPQIEATSLKENEDWSFKVTVVERPEVKLSGYKEKIQKELAPSKIVVPGKEETEAQKKASEEQKIGNILKILKESAAVDIPQPLVDQEVQRKLSSLIDQTARLGLTVDQYLSRTGKTKETITKEYDTQSREDILMELVLDAVARNEQVEVTQAEIEQAINSAPDEETRKALSTSDQKLYLASIIRKRKTVDKLMSL